MCTLALPHLGLQLVVSPSCPFRCCECHFSENLRDVTDLMGSLVLGRLRRGVFTSMIVFEIVWFCTSFDLRPFSFIDRLFSCPLGVMGCHCR